MPLLLPSILNRSQRPHQPLLLLQSSIAQSCLPVLRKIINNDDNKGRRVPTVLICFLHPPSSLVDHANVTSQELEGAVKVLDFTGRVPGFDDSWTDLREDIFASVKNGELS